MVPVLDTQQLVKAVSRLASSKAKDEKLWSSLSERARVLLVHMDKAELVNLLASFGRGGYQCKRLLREMSPLLTKQVGNFSAAEISACLNALRAVEHRELDLVQLLLNQMTVIGAESEISAKDLALVMNAAAHFRVHDANFWRATTARLQEISDQLTPQGLTLVVAALAKVDRRDKRLLEISQNLVIGNFIQKFRPAELAVTVGAFYRLDWPLPWEEISDSIRKEIGNFDNQAAVSIFHGAFALGKISDPEIFSLLADRLRSAPLGSEQRRKFHDTLEISGHKISDQVESPAVESPATPKWVRAVLGVLRSEISLQPVCEGGEWHFRSADGDRSARVALDFQGPFSFYAESRRLTATAKFRQRLLRHRGFQVLAIPYFEWRELRDRDERLAYLYTRGRATKSII